MIARDCALKDRLRGERNTGGEGRSLKAVCLRMEWGEVRSYKGCRDN